MGPVGQLIQRIKKNGLEYFGLYYGEYPAFVLSVDDPQNRNRLKVHPPGITVDAENGLAAWADCSYISSKSYGMQALPKVGELVTLTFIGGNLRRPRWKFGWYAKGEMPTQFKNKDDYGFITKEGHYVIFRDGDDNNIELFHKDGKKVILNTDDIILNEGDNEGLVKVKELTDKLNNLENKVNNFITTFSTHTHVGNLAVPTSPPPVSPTQLTVTKQADIENKEVKH